MLSRKLAALAVALAAGVLVACGAGRVSGPAPASNAMLPIPLGDDLAIVSSSTLPTVRIEEPAEGLGSIYSKAWKAKVGGYTQKTYSQVLGFSPGTKITIHNKSTSISHTLNVIKVVSGPPADFPLNPTLRTTPHGGDKLQKGYRSGTIAPGKSVTVILEKGKYLIGCAYHYKLPFPYKMRDVLVVERGATPGPQATPP